MSKDVPAKVIQALSQCLAKNDMRFVELAIATLQELALDEPVLARLRNDEDLPFPPVLLNRVAAHTD